jgi:hypothetical protein
MKRNLKENNKTEKVYNVAQGKWTLENIAKGIKDFYSEHNRYPTANDFDTYSKLPSARHIQRKFHGLKKLRETLKLSEKDFTKGSHSRNRAQFIFTRQKKVLSGVHRYIKENLSKSKIVRDFSFTDDGRSRVDFYLQNKAQNCAVDVFYSKDDGSLIGSINRKQEKYSGDNYLRCSVILLSTNKTISQDRVNLLVSRKKKALGNNQYVLAWESFKYFLDQLDKNKKVEEILDNIRM